MTSDIVHAALQSIEIAKDFNEDQLEKLGAIATYVTFSVGATIFEEGDESELVYIIIEGKVNLLTMVPGRGDVEILSLGSGDLLGWSSLFPPKKKTASAQTRTTTSLIAIKAQQLTDLCQVDHVLGYKLMIRVARVIAHRLQTSRNLILGLLATAKDTDLLALEAVVDGQKIGT